MGDILSVVITWHWRSVPVYLLTSLYFLLILVIKKHWLCWILLGYIMLQLSLDRITRLAGLPLDDHLHICTALHILPQMFHTSFFTIMVSIFIVTAMVYILGNWWFILFSVAIEVLFFCSCYFDVFVFIYFFFLLFQLWDINMNSGPVATFQVHEYLRPKVILYMLRWIIHTSLRIMNNKLFHWSNSDSCIASWNCSYVIYMKMIPFLISLSAVKAEMDWE